MSKEAPEFFITIILKFEPYDNEVKGLTKELKVGVRKIRGQMYNLILPTPHSVNLDDIKTMQAMLKIVSGILDSPKAKAVLKNRDATLKREPCQT